ncbi:MAG: rod shape-determining protein [Victivallales bacterium]|nr:rod shape-determining protein [Victivallales bacterium]
MTNFLTSFFHNDIGIDLGTMNTLIFARGRGIVLNEPTVVAVNSTTNDVLAVGHEAKKMLGVNPGNIRAVRPMRKGVIKDPHVTDKMLRRFMEMIANPFCLMQPRVVVAVPSRITVVESQAVIESVKRAGARDVRLVEEPFAAAVGAGLPVANPTANMIVDIGGGTAEIAVVSLGGIVHCNSVEYAGDAFDDAITRHMKENHNLSIGELTAERIKIEIGSAVPFAELKQEEKTMEVSGLKLRAQGDHLPSTVTVTSEEIRQALQDPLNEIVAGIGKTLSACKPELAGDLPSNGMTITGGGSRLPGIDVMLRKHFHMAVHKDEHPMEAVTRGVGTIMDKYNIFGHPQADLVGVNVD